MSTAVAPKRRPAVRLGLRENVAQFTLLVIVNAFVGAMVGMERSILWPLLPGARRRSASIASGGISATRWAHYWRV